MQMQCSSSCSILAGISRATIFSNRVIRGILTERLKRGKLTFETDQVVNPLSWNREYGFDPASPILDPLPYTISKKVWFDESEMVAQHRLGAHRIAIAFRIRCGAGTHTRYRAKPLQKRY